MQAAHVRINSGKDRPAVTLFLIRNYQRLVTHFFRMYKVFFGKRIIFSRRDFLPAFSGEEPVKAETDVMRYSGWLSNEAMKLTMKLNNSYHTPEEIREILSELTGKEVDETVSLFPPFIQTAERISALAGAVVTRDVPENMVVAGTPAKVIRAIK